MKERERRIVEHGESLSLGEIRSLFGTMETGDEYIGGEKGRLLSTRHVAVLWK